MYGGDSSPPPAPDYSALAKEQGAANLTAAQQSGMMSNPNVIGPTGSRTVTWNKQYQSPEVAAVDKSKFYSTSGNVNYQDPKYEAAAVEWGRRNNIRNPVYQYAATPEGAAALAATKGQIFDQAAYDKAMKDYETAVAERESKALVTPTIEEKLTPEAQATLEAQQRTNKALALLGERSIGRVEDVMGKGFQYQGPDIRTSFEQTPGVTSDFGGYRDVNYGPEAGQFGWQEGGVTAPELARELKGVYQAPVNAGTTAQQAIMSRLQPQLERQRTQLETQLANQGVRPGSAAYNMAMQEQSQRENDLLSQASLQGVNLDMSAQQQAFNQALQTGQFGNEAALSGFQSALMNQEARNAAMRGNFGQAAQAAGMYNQAQGQAYQQALNKAQFGNQAAAQAFNQAQQRAAFENQANEQAFQRQLGLYNLPLNQVSALMSGSQVQIPQFQAFQGSNVQAAPLFQAGQAQNQYNMDVYNADVARQNAEMGMLGQMAGSGMQAAAIMASDRRLKENIEKIGTLDSGLNIYKFKYKGKDGIVVGVMSDEVRKIFPDAVIVGEDGFDRVDYSKLV